MSWKPPAACLIGWPAAHSRSPLIHHYWLRTLGIEGGYVIEAVPPDEFKDFVFRLSLRGFVGANVTIPHKERALALSKPDARARAVGAANTLWFENGELCSTNTDVEGFIDNLDASAPGWDTCEEALVLGAGGSSRAVVFGLLDRGIKRIASRQPHDRARPRTGGSVRRQRPAGGVGCARRSPAARRAPGEYDVARHEGSAAARTRCRAAAVTRRRRRSCLRAARHAIVDGSRARGLKTADGLGMLLHQAVRGFELWFGRRPEVTAELRALVEADLTNT